MEPVSVLTGGMLHLATGGAIAEKKLQNLEKFLALFPEMDVILLGDAGQADAAFFAAALQSHGHRVKASFLHNVTPDAETTGDGGQKADYSAAGIHLFDTYIGAASAACSSGVISAAAAQRVAAATVLECSIMCRGNQVGTSLMSTLTDMLHAAGVHTPLPSADVVAPTAASHTGLRSSVKRVRWQRRMQGYADRVQADLAQLASTAGMQKQSSLEHAASGVD
jgi:hypothetical protein